MNKRLNCFNNFEILTTKIHVLLFLRLSDGKEDFPNSWLDKILIKNRSETFKGYNSMSTSEVLTLISKPCVCVCILFIYTISISIICVSQEEPSLIACNQQIYELQIIFGKKRHCHITVLLVPRLILCRSILSLSKMAHQM